MQISYSTSHQALLNQYFIAFSLNMSTAATLKMLNFWWNILWKQVSWESHLDAVLGRHRYSSPSIRMVYGGDWSMRWTLRPVFPRYSLSGESSHLSQNLTSFNNPFLEWNHFSKILLFWCFSSPNWFVHRPRSDLNLNAFDWIWIAAPKSSQSPKENWHGKCNLLFFLQAWSWSIRRFVSKSIIPENLASHKSFKVPKVPFGEEDMALRKPSIFTHENIHP